MPEYGYLHMGRITGIDTDSGGYLLDSVGLARTSKWGPVPSCVPGLRKGDRVVLGATGTSRDNLIIIAKVGAEFADIADIAGLLDALHSKADVVAIDQLANWSTALETRIGALETGAGGLDTRLDAAEADIDALQADSVSQDARLDTLEAKTVSGGSWYVAESYECPGTTVLDTCDRMPFAGQLWKFGSDVTLGPDNKHWIINKGGIWHPTFAPRWTTPVRYPSGTAGEGTDRSFHIGVTSREIGPNNCTFETGISGWTLAGGTGSFAASTTQKHSGTQSMRVTPSGSSASVGPVSSKIVVVPGEKVTATSWAWFTTAVTTNYSSAVNWYDASNVFISTSFTMVSVGAALWTPVIQSYTAPVGAAFAAIVPLLGGTPAASNIFYIDDVSIGPSLSDSGVFLFEENWNEVNTGNQHNQTKKLGGDLLLGAGDKMFLYAYWGGVALTDRLIFPASSNRMSLTYVGPT
jgi:Carbohydrate binding domain